MKPKRRQTFWVSTAFFFLIFMALFLTRIGMFENKPDLRDVDDISSFENFSDKNTWKNIFQNENKIGFSHSSYSKLDRGYRFNESVFMRINTMGMIQDVGLKTRGILDADFSLKSFYFEITSGRFNFSANGNIVDKVLTLTTKSSGTEQTITSNLTDNIYFSSGIVQAASSGKLKAGDRISLKVFDPISMGQEPILLAVLGEEEININGEMKTAKKISLTFKGATQLAWLDENGDILKEKGLLGITLVRTTREDAVNGLPVQSSQDITQVASIPSNINITNPASLKRLEAEIGGVENVTAQLSGGRQIYIRPLLIIEKEQLNDLPVDNSTSPPPKTIAAFLQPSPFIQSDHEAIQRLSAQLVTNADLPIEKAKKIVAWIQAHIKRRPVISLPDALSTLENRVGDCNEHAVLFAALARAAGIPAKVEAGIVYLRNRFYYHAWNAIFIDRWVTVDSLFNQIPADVTHIRLASGMQKDQLDILSLIGKLNIHIRRGE